MKGSFLLALLLAWHCLNSLATAQTYKNSVACLFENRDDDDPESRSQAVGSLVQSYSASPVAVMPELKKLCRDIDVNVRLTAATKLGELGKPAVPLLVELLKDRHRIVRVAAISPS